MKGNRDEEALSKLIEKVGEAETNGDADAFVSLMTVDAVMMPPNGSPVAGAEAIRDWWKAALSQVCLEVTQAEPQEIGVSGDLAFVRVSYSHIATMKSDGASLTESGKSIWIARRGNGAWLFSHVIWNTNA